MNMKKFLQSFKVSAWNIQYWEIILSMKPDWKSDLIFSEKSTCLWLLSVGIKKVCQYCPGGNVHSYTHTINTNDSISNGFIFLTFSGFLFCFVYVCLNLFFETYNLCGFILSAYFCMSKNSNHTNRCSVVKNQRGL